MPLRLAIAALALCALMPTAQAAPIQIEPHVFVPALIGTPRQLEAKGRFTITFVPIMCIRAPCPPGRYSIASDGKLIAVVRSVVLEDATEGKVRTRTFKAEYLPFTGFEGSLRVDEGTAFVHADHFFTARQP